MKNVTVYEGCDYPENATEFLEFVRRILNSVPDEFKEITQIEITPSLVSAHGIVCIYYRKEG